jgi:3-hydroxy-3-methylglutaryl CoA synthase
VPRHRLPRASIAAALGAPAGKGARAVASYDEDSTSMGLEAARRTVADAARPASIHFATSSPAYADKTNAVAIHAALGLGHDGFAVDIAGSVRGATGAWRAAAACDGLAVLADIRTGRPGSGDETGGGDGAAAFLFGTGDGVIARSLAEESATAEFLDRWRLPGEASSQVWEERFGVEMYLPLIRDVAARALAAAGVETPDHVIVSSPHARTARTASGAFAPETVAGGATEAIGYTGAADAGLALVEVLERAAPGETILVLVAADGCDASVLQATDALARYRQGRAPLSDQLTSGREVSYPTFLTWRGMLEREPPRRPEPVRPAAPPSARAEDWKFAFVGSRCDACSRVHLPPRRVCAGCGVVDRMSPAPLADERATVATFTIDRLAYSPSPPVIDVVVDYDAGGRFCCQLTDAIPDEVAIGDRVEMTFRRFYTSGAVHNYFWKARPVAVMPEEAQANG